MIPIIKELLYPFLLFLKDGELSYKDIKNKLIEYFGLSRYDIELRTREGNSSQLDNRISWCRQYLRWALFIDVPKRSICKLTERGKEFLESHDSLTIDDLMRYHEFAMHYGKRYSEKKKYLLPSGDYIEKAIIEENSVNREQIVALYIEYSNLDETELASLIYDKLESYIQQIRIKEDEFTITLSNQKERLEEEKKQLLNLIFKFLEQGVNTNDTNLISEIRDTCNRIISLEDTYQKALQIHSISHNQIYRLSKLYINRHLYSVGDDDFSQSSFSFFYEMPDNVFDIINRFEYPSKFTSELVVILAPILASYWGIDIALITAFLAYTLKEYLKTLYQEKKLKRISIPVKSKDGIPLIEAPASKKRTKAPTKGLRVEFPDGTVICNQNAIETLIDTLKKIGFQTVSKLQDVKHKGYTLVSKHKRATVPGRIWQHECNGWYIYSNISNDQKIKDLKKISKFLNLGLIISEERP